MSRGGGLDLEAAARLLVDAELLGDEDAAKKHGVSVKTVGRYRSRAAANPMLLDVIAEKRALVDAEWSERRKAEVDAKPVPPPADESLRAYIERISPPSELPIPWHIEQLIALLERAVMERVFAIVAMPPRHAKTTTVTRALAWAIRRFPERLNAIGMYAEKSAWHQSRRIRKLIRDDGVQLLAGAQSVGLWQTAREGGLFAAGASGQWTGKGVGGVIVLDDILKGHEQAESPVIREKLWQTIVSDILSRPEPPVGSVVMVNTRWNEDDPSGRILRLSGTKGWPKFEVLNLPALRDPKTGDPSDADDAIALWPSRFPREELVMRRAIEGPYKWNALYQGRPTSADGAVFRAQWLKHYWTKLPPGGVFIQSWDMAFSLLTASTDFVVGQLWYQCGTKFYLVDQICRRMNFAETLDAVRELSSRCPEAITKLIEAKANGPSVAAALEREIPGIVLVQPSEQGNKTSRARAVEGLFASASVMLPDPQLAEIPHARERGAPWLASYVAEMLAFPAGKHDDQVDATTQALNHLAMGTAALLESVIDNVYAPRCEHCGERADSHASTCSTLTPLERLRAALARSRKAS